MKVDEAIGFFDWMKNVYLMSDMPTAREACDMAISALKKQKDDGWIPVKERLPKKDGRYLITDTTDGAKVLDGYFCRTKYDNEPYWGYLQFTCYGMAANAGPLHAKGKRIRSGMEDSI